MTGQHILVVDDDDVLVAEPQHLDERAAHRHRVDDAAGQIGAHTRTHCDLGATNDQEQLLDEVVTSGEELQRMIGGSTRPIPTFPAIASLDRIELYQLPQSPFYCRVRFIKSHGYSFPEKHLIFNQVFNLCLHFTFCRRAIPGSLKTLVQSLYF